MVKQEAYSRDTQLVFIPNVDVLNSDLKIVNYFGDERLDPPRVFRVFLFYEYLCECTPCSIPNGVLGSVSASPRICSSSAFSSFDAFAAWSLSSSSAGSKSVSVEGTARRNMSSMMISVG
jgi:hypothetical protein